MSDPSDTTASRRRKRRRKAIAATPAAEPAVQVILEQALHPDPAALDIEAADAGAPDVEARGVEAADVEARGAAKPSRRRRGGRRSMPSAEASSGQGDGNAAMPASVAPETDATVPIEASAPDPSEPPEAPDAPVAAETAEAVDTGDASGDAIDIEFAPVARPDPPASPISDWHDVTATWKVTGDLAETPPPADRDDDGDAAREDHHEDAAAPHDGDATVSGLAPPPAPPAPPAAPHAPVPHHWVYLAVGLFVAALGFGVWGVWTVFFAGGDGSGTSVAALRTRSDRLSQEVSTLRRSDQISRDANRDLERTLAERDEEIASLRADIAFYERFVGATGQRRGLSVHDLEMRRQDGDAWHFVATLTQNVNRGAVNSGRLTLSIEGTRHDRMERLAWTTLRKQPNAPGAEYSFKYFQQLEGEILLPADFKPLRVTVRLVPQGGAAVEQSFPWPETLHSVAGG